MKTIRSGALPVIVVVALLLSPSPFWTLRATVHADSVPPGGVPVSESLQIGWAETTLGVVVPPGQVFVLTDLTLASEGYSTNATVRIYDTDASRPRFVGSLYLSAQAGAASQHYAFQTGYVFSAAPKMIATGVVRVSVSGYLINARR